MLSSPKQNCQQAKTSGSLEKSRATVLDYYNNYARGRQYAPLVEFRMEAVDYRKRLAVSYRDTLCKKSCKTMQEH